MMRMSCPRSAAGGACSRRAVHLAVARRTQLVGGQLERALVVVGRDDQRHLMAAVGELRDRPAAGELHVVAVRLEHDHALPPPRRLDRLRLRNRLHDRFSDGRLSNGCGLSAHGVWLLRVGF